MAAENTEATEVVTPRRILKPFAFHFTDPCNSEPELYGDLENRHLFMLDMIDDYTICLDRPISQELHQCFPIDAEYSDFDPWTDYLEFARHIKGELNGESIEYYSFRDGSYVCENRGKWYVSVKGESLPTRWYHRRRRRVRNDNE